MNAMLSEWNVGRIILAGAPEITAELHAHLPKKLSSRVIGKVDLAIDATTEEIRNTTMPVSEKHEQEAEESVVSDLVTSAAKARRAVVGLENTLRAVHHHRVWHLVFAEGLASPGCECSRCGALFSGETNSCSLCGATVQPVDDVVERVVDQAIRKDARIEVVRSQRAESLLMSAGGIGAFLRTRAINARAS
jgi:peptide subunit release factor 1 (eRF1)